MKFNIILVVVLALCVLTRLTALAEQGHGELCPRCLGRDTLKIANENLNVQLPPDALPKPGWNPKATGSEVWQCAKCREQFRVTLTQGKKTKTVNVKVDKP